MTDHKLTAAGAAFDADFTRVDPTTTAGTGRAVCHCGEISGVLTSGRARKAWFATHKAVTETEIDPRDEAKAQSEDEIQAELDAQAEAREKVLDDLAAMDPDLGGKIADALLAGTDPDRASATVIDGALEGESGDLPAEEPEQGDTEADREQTPEEAARYLWIQRALRGNYSIETAPIAKTLAWVWSPDLKVTIKVSSAVLRFVDIEGPRQAVESFAEILDTFLGGYMDELKAWQKETVDERRGMTDMQKFNAHRAYLRKLGERLAEGLAR